MSRIFLLFSKDFLSFKEKFSLLMDLLISNQTSSRMESILFLSIYYIQIISGFFAKQIGVVDLQDSISDQVLNYIQKILRFKDLFLDSYQGYQVSIYILFTLVVLFSLLFTIQCANIAIDSFYTFWEVLLNFYIKSFIFAGFNIILDLTLSNYCFGTVNGNPNFEGVSCNVGDNLPLFFISLMLLLFSVFWDFFIQFFYCDSFYLSTSFYSKISCNYEIFININCIAYSILLTQANVLSKEIFLVYNLIVSLFFLNFYLNRYLYYDQITNLFAGLFHALYAWTSLFCLIFAYVEFKEKGIIYLVSSSIVLYFYYNFRFKLEEYILLDTPFYKISNKHYLLYYIKNLIDKINKIEESPEEKALLTGLMQMHILECPNPQCLSKTKKKLYLPITNEWSDRSKPLINDHVFLMNFVIVVMNFFISQSYYSPDMIINISLYYLQIIGNYCQSIYYYKKVKEMKLTYQETFSFVRLQIAISKALVEKCKEPNEPCLSLEDLNVTQYFKYEDLSQQLFEEMNNDVNLSLEFWKTFKNSLIDSAKTIDFNKIFDLTDKIRITKNKVELLWGKLFKIFNGVNELFELYLNYVEQLNDDDLLKRELEGIKRKNENSSDNIQLNFYNLLFNKDTGIIIASGDKGNEGVIEKVNNEVEAIFKFKPDELRGMNLSNLMPKLFEKHHKSLMERYFEIGEKRVIDNKEFKSFAKDKDNSLIKIKLAIKLFPMLNENVYFVSLLIKENIDDIIFIDSRFIIQGMSMKLIKILQIDNNFLFQENDIPFYVICKKFVNFYKIFLQKKKGHHHKDKNKKSLIDATHNINNEDSSIISNNIQIDFDVTANNNNNLIQDNDNPNDAKDNSNNPNRELTQKETEMHNENIEINENIELEYEIRIPQFLIDYSSSTNKREQKLDFKAMKTQNEESDNEKEMNEENNTIDEYGESDLLVDDQKGEGAKKATTDEKILNSPKTNQFSLEAPMNQKIEFNKQSEEEKEFLVKINKHKEMFEAGNFNELEDLIDSCNVNSSINDFKFNFTFDKYLYGDKQIAYVVRCIDNKNEIGRFDEESVGIDIDPNMRRHKTNKGEALKPLIELFEEEKVSIINSSLNYLNLCLDNLEFQSALFVSKEEINKMSIIHGQKKEEVLDDENSSQSSQAGFNADLCKKNRIEEIRSNTLQNVSDFYTLKYIKILVFLTAVITGVFCALYIVFFFNVHSDLTTINHLNIDLYQSCVWLSNLVSTLISLRTYFTFKHQKLDFSINEYTSNYFETMREKSFYWYDQIVVHFPNLECKIQEYIDNSETVFWDNNNVTYNYSLLNDQESFPISLMQVTSNTNSLLRHTEFNSNPKDLASIDFINYLGFLSIENTYDNLLPAQYDKIHLIPIKFQKHITDSITIFLIIVVIYSCVIVSFCFVYEIFLYITNKNMGEGLEKITKVKIEKIEETIKRIENFNFQLRKIREKDLKMCLQDSKPSPKIDHQGNSNSNQNETKHALNGLYNDTKKNKPLNKLSTSYFQIIGMAAVLGGFLIPILLISDEMANNTNQLIHVQNFLFGKLLIAASSTVKVKCNMSECLTTQQLEYNDLINKSHIQEIVQGISLFPELDEFYNRKFLLNACDAVFDKDKEKEKHEECLSDPLIQSANNTDSLLKLLEETIDNIYKEKEMNSDITFKSFSLYKTESFKELESILYKYITPVSDTLAEVIIESLDNYLNFIKALIIILICLFGVIVVCMCFYIGFIFVHKLIHLLSVSRCILRIIPTFVLNHTQELENWINK